MSTLWLLRAECEASHPMGQRGPTSNTASEPSIPKDPRSHHCTPVGVESNSIPLTRATCGMRPYLVFYGSLRFYWGSKQPSISSVRTGQYCFLEAGRQAARLACGKRGGAGRGARERELSLRQRIPLHCCSSKARNAFVCLAWPLPALSVLHVWGGPLLRALLRPSKSQLHTQTHQLSRNTKF